MKTLRRFAYVGMLSGGVAMAPSFLTAAGGETVLIRDGVSRASIVLLPEGGKLEKLAAEELQTHIKKMSRAEIPVVGNQRLAQGVKVLIGRAALDPGLEEVTAGGDDPASFRIRVARNMVQLAGLSDEGTLFAVYELLEQLGVRWFMPGEIGTVIPEAETVAVREQDTIQHPGFCGRRLSDIPSQWFLRMRMGGFDAGAHGFPWRSDPEKEPELFVHENGRPTHQLRVSNPEVLARTVQVCLDHLKTSPTTRYLNIGPDDGAGFGTDPWDADDLDPLHGKVSVTDRYIKFYNLVLEELQKQYPEVGVAFYCYSLYMRPPVREKPNPRILPVLAPIDVCRLHVIDNPLCWERRYIRQIVDGWQALGVKMMYRGYLFNLADQGLPFSMIRQVASEWPYYHKRGIIAVRVEAHPAWAYHGPALYLAAKIMWNPQLDVEATLDDYFSKFYGPARVPMREHFERLEDAFEQADYHTGNVFDMPHILTPQVMAELEATHKEAERLAPKGSVFAARVGMVRLAFEFGRANLKMMAAVNAFDFAEAKKQWDLIKNEILPQAVSHDPPIINPGCAGYADRFWGETVKQGYERTSGGNQIVAKLPDEWLFILDPYNGGEALGLWLPGVGTQSWTPLKTYSQSWSNQGLRYYKGEAWYRTTVEVPAKHEGRQIRLWLGGIDDQAKAWINGLELPLLSAGAAPTGVPWEFDATQAIAFGKQNVVVVKVSNRELDELGTGGITGPAMLWAEAP